MKIKINALAAREINSRSPNLAIELEMTEPQMYQALNEFLRRVPDETWAKWQEQINDEVYGAEMNTKFTDEDHVARNPNREQAMKLANKWKVFSIQQHFSHEPTVEEAVVLFAALDAVDNTADAEKVLENTLIWQPFDALPTLEFVDMVVGTARIAQQVENMQPGETS